MKTKMNIYKEMTDAERMTALWSHSIQIERLCRRKKILVDNPPSNESADKWKAEIDNVASEIKLARAEIKALWKATIQ